MTPRIDVIFQFSSITNTNEARISYKKGMQGWRLPRMVVERHDFAKKHFRQLFEI